jgi:peptidoglycan-N-acetylglucosamine deacetylase
MIITTSWDDGHRLDNRLAEMLSCYGLKGTFYVARDFLEARLSDADIRQLSQSHEIGAHTLNHPTLTELPLDRAKEEIEGSKAWLEDLLGKPVNAFCYPRGASSLALEEIVENAAYTMARGVQSYQLDIGERRYNIPTSLQVYPFPLRPLPKIPFPHGIPTRLQPLRRGWQALNKLEIAWSARLSWESLARATLEKAKERDGIWHLWGHSWEIEEYGMWDALERVLKVAQGYSAQVLINSELVSSGEG